MPCTDAHGAGTMIDISRGQHRLVLAIAIFATRGLAGGMGMDRRVAEFQAV